MALDRLDHFSLWPRARSPCPCSLMLAEEGVVESDAVRPRRTLLPLGSRPRLGRIRHPPRVGSTSRPSDAATTSSSPSTGRAAGHPPTSPSPPPAAAMTCRAAERAAIRSSACVAVGGERPQALALVRAPAATTADGGAWSRPPTTSSRARSPTCSASKTLIATELERDLGPFTGPHRRRRRSREGKIGGSTTGWLTRVGALGRFRATSVYSDSTNDLPLLERASIRWPPTLAGARGGGIASAAGPSSEPLRRMIKKFINRLLGKSAGRRAGRPAPRPAPRRSRSAAQVEVPAEQHGIDRTLVDERAVAVRRRYRRGRATRPTSSAARCAICWSACGRRTRRRHRATPEQVKSLFRRAFIIGRRFRIVHVVFGRGRDHEVIEVSTFRA